VGEHPTYFVIYNRRRKFTKALGPKEESKTCYEMQEFNLTSNVSLALKTTNFISFTKVNLHAAKDS